MNSDTAIDYYHLFAKYVTRLAALSVQRDEIDLEATKLRELMLATFPLLPADKQKIFQKEIDEIETQSGGLLAAIKLVFSRHKEVWLTPPQVRDYLNEMGFDLTKYRANPLASIGTTMKRLADTDARIESKVVDSQTTYRRRTSLLEHIGSQYKQGFDPDKLPDEVRDAVHPVRKLAKGMRFRRPVDVSGRTSAYDSGMRGDEKPKK
ncbi:MAG TPA: hypothetical protein VND65_05835 [Candidatus Binatia bacterium]|nr:hypothetical protein [Candidatus Binatia bacterium]